MKGKKGVDGVANFVLFSLQRNEKGYVWENKQQLAISKIELAELILSLRHMTAQCEVEYAKQIIHYSVTGEKQ